MIWLPSAGEVEKIHYEIAKSFELENDPISPVGVKFPSMLESACQRPNTSLGECYKYKSLEHKLAALFHSLTKNHAFHNGNKRTAIVTLLTALYRNNRLLTPSVGDDEIYDFVVSVTADEFPKKDHGLDDDAIIEVVANWIKVNSESLNNSLSEMKTSEFRDKCVKAGANCKNASGGVYVISNKSRSIRISKSTKKINGSVILRYLRELGFAEAAAGISLNEFQDGVNDERKQIHRYMVALRRLAKT
ncbi:type II toxin-antitoxin system death-on-curing family toxin [Chitinimonas lacunae]|uniref:Type II toxin-antitoxin system death-on-curing family toxin n=1 Tax=Chitinimonas lacunae TaxID=1963018 RepID=A0ABV8MPZ5_9NEIS